MSVSYLNKRSRTQQALGLVYAQKPAGGIKIDLTTDLFLPKPSAPPAPLLVWLGPDILTDRAINPEGSRRLADVLTRNGVALAAPKVRVDAERADLPDQVVQGLARIEPHRDASTDSQISTFPAIAATEDVCDLLNWLNAEGEELGLSGQVVLAGASLGACLAFSVALAAPNIGLSRPDPLGVLSYSGTCAWPGLFSPGILRVFALHNPNDQRMPIAPLRLMAERDAQFELMEAMEQAHGSLGLWPQETAQEACERILSRVRLWSAA